MIKQLMNSAFVRYEELGRSLEGAIRPRWIPSSICLILYILLKPNSLKLIKDLRKPYERS